MAKLIERWRIILCLLLATAAADTVAILVRYVTGSGYINVTAYN